MQTVSFEVKEIFQNPEFEGMLKTLANEFGEETTLKSIYYWFQQNRVMPLKTVNGKIYTAGYCGAKMISEGLHSGKLIDIKQTGNICKLMFSINGIDIFLYHNILMSDLKAEQIVRLGSNINEIFPITVKHETIVYTGDKHAVITDVSGLKEILNDK